MEHCFPLGVTVLPAAGSPLRQFSPWFPVLVLLLALTACAEGEVIGPLSRAGVVQELSLVRTGSGPANAGDPFTVQATYTENGEPVGGVDVMFTAVCAGTERRVEPSTVPTDTTFGTADTTIYPEPIDPYCEVTAIARTRTTKLNLSLPSAQPTGQP